MKTDITMAADQALTAEDVPQPAKIPAARRRASMPASMLRRVPSYKRKPPASVLSAPTQGFMLSPHSRPKQLVSILDFTEVFFSLVF